MLKSLVVAAALIMAVPATAEPQPVAELGPGMVGVYYPPAQKGGPVVMLLGGSEGGFQGSGAMAKAMAEQGFGALALSYYRGPGQSPTLENIPLETFTSALDWLSARPEVGRRRVAVVGVSKGGEAALLIASRDRRVCAVVAAVPSNVSWAGYDPARNLGTMTPSWTSGGQPVAYAHYDFSGFANGGLRGIYAKSLEKAPADAIIPVEKIAGPVLLISGRDDKLWPSTPMADAVMARLDGAKFRYAYSHLVYDNAGHAAFGRPVAADTKVNPAMFAQAGGTFEGTNTARMDNWPKALAFLKANLEGKGCASLH
jgi:dienelactone hydrolase